MELRQPTKKDCYYHTVKDEKHLKQSMQPAENTIEEGAERALQ